MNFVPLAPLLLLLLAAGQVQGQPTGVATRTVAPRGVALVMPFDGVVEARRQVTVAAQVPGRLLEVHADAGQRVGQGQLLARIDARESAEAHAAARANAQAAKAALERTRRLVAQNYMSPAGLDQAQATYAAAAAQVEATQVYQGHAAVRSPLAGLVAVRHAEAGELAAPGRALFTIYQPAGMRLVVEVPQARLAEVRASKTAVLEFPELGQRLESSAITVLPAMDGETHTATVRVDLPAGADLVWPGMAGRVRFESRQNLRLTVPKGALVRRGELAGVYVSAPGGGFRLRQLRLGEALADGEVEVLAGLLAGETIALDAVAAALSARR